MNEKAITNFIASIDLTLPIENHFMNAVWDQIEYGWDDLTLQLILIAVVNLYSKKDAEQVNKGEQRHRK